MKKIFLLLAIASVTLFTACYDDDDEPNTQENSSVVSIESSSTFSPKEMATAIANSAYVQDYLGGSNLFTLAVNSMCQVTAAGNGLHLDTLFAKKEGSFLLTYKRSWHIESYTFNYRSVSSKGEPIMLSGRVSFPKGDKYDEHQVKSLSLYAHAMANAAGVPSRSVQPAILRTLFNSAVIEPDYQGYGIAQGNNYPGFSSEVLAQQMTDCIMAALEVMKSNGVTLAKGGYSTAWGNSVAAPAILGFARYYDEKMSDDDKAKINLKSVSISNGVLLSDQMVQYFDQHQLYNPELTAYVLPFINAMPGLVLEGYALKDLAPEWMQYQIVDINGESCSFFYAMTNGLEYRSVWPKEYRVSMLKNHFAAEMFNDKGRFNYSNVKTMLLMNILHGVSDWGGWQPSMDVYMTHSKFDDRMPYSQAEAFASSKSASRNVHFKDVKLPTSNLVSLSSHRNLCANSLLTSLRYEDPAKAYKKTE